MLAIKKMGPTLKLKKFFVILISLLGIALASAELHAKSVSDPNHQGWSGKHPTTRPVTWKPIKTKCDKCTKIAEQYNETVQELLASRFWVDVWREKHKVRKEARASQVTPFPGQIGEDLSLIHISEPTRPY